MASFTCPACQGTWPENYCPTCGSTIRKEEAPPGIPPLVGSARPRRARIIGAAATPPPLPPASARAAMPPETRGRIMLAALFLSFLALDAGFSLFAAVQHGAGNLPASAVRILLTAGWMVLVWSGVRWARWAMVAVLGVAFVLGLACQFPVPDPRILSYAVGGLILALVLAYSKSVDAFLALQRLPRRRDL